MAGRTEHLIHLAVLFVAGEGVRVRHPRRLARARAKWARRQRVRVGWSERSQGGMQGLPGPQLVAEWWTVVCRAGKALAWYWVSGMQ